MSNSDEASTVGNVGGLPRQPRAMIHKKILEAAEESPNASIEGLADEISGASAGLVERVLDEYGDPAGEADESATQSPQTDKDDGANSSPAVSGTDGPPLIADGATSGANVNGSSGDVESTTVDAGSDHVESSNAAVSEDDDRSSADGDDSQSEAPPDPGETAAETDDDPGSGPTLDRYDEKERRLLRAVAVRPAATQQALADALDVSRATVSRRVSDMDGLEWSSRAAFVDELFDEEDLAAVDEDAFTQTPDPDDAETTGDRNDAETAGDQNDVASQSSTATGDLPQSSRANDGETGQSAALEDVTDSVAELSGRVDALAAAVESLESRTERSDSNDGTSVDDPELVHKILRASMDADYVTEDEELQIVRQFVTGDDPT